MRVACCQFEIAWEDKAANYGRVEAMVRAAGLEPGTLLLLPEMFATGFSMDAERIAEPLDGPTAEVVGSLARQHNIHVLAGVVLRPDDGSSRPRNEALLFGPDGRLACRYAKVHRFTFAGEDGHYGAGERPVTCDVAGWRVQPAVCYDLRFPELFRTPAARGAELICIIANWPEARESHWLALLKARAIENQAYVAAVNRCGRDPNVVYSGRSQVIDPRGEVLADAGGDERIITADLDLKSLRDYCQKFPALRDVRL
jgi:predicted amidohydrolase